MAIDYIKKIRTEEGSKNIAAMYDIDGNLLKDTYVKNESVLYTNSTPTVNALGGIAAGETFDDEPITNMLTRLLYPWVAPVVKATSTPNGGTFEKGTTQTVTAISTTITKKSARITNVEVFNDSTSLGAKTGSDLDTINNSGTGTLTFTVSVPVTASNTKFTVKVTDADGKTTSANTGTFTFVYPYYYGVVAADASISETLIEGLTKKVEAKGNKAWSFTADNQKTVFAYPKSYDVLNKIKDPSGFELLGGYTREELSITGLEGTTQQYYVYMSDTASTVTGFTITFSY